MFLVLTGCGGSILDESSLDTNSIQIQGITVTSGSTTASVLWTTDVPATHKISYGTVSGNYTLSTAESTTESTTHMVELPALVTDQTYYYIIVCNSGGYEIAQSGEFSFSTSSTISVNSLGAGSITTSSAVITWTTGVETTHIVEYGTTAGVYTQSTIQTDTASTNHSVSLSGLTSGTEYFFRVKNFHSTLPYTSSIELSFQTTGFSSPNLTERLRSIWIIGGASSVAGTTFYQEIDLYDPVTHIWYPNVAQLPVALAFPMVASLNGKIYIMGGATTKTSTTSIVYEYTVSSNTWVLKEPMLASIMDAAVYTNGNIIYTMGGTTTTVTSNAVTTHYRFDPNGGGGSGIWASVPPIALPVAKTSFGAFNFNGTVVYAGGRTSAGAGLTTNDIYQINQNAYSGATEQVLTATFGYASGGYSGANGTFFFTVGGASATTAATAYFGLTAITYVPSSSSWMVYTPPATANGVYRAADFNYYHPAFTGDTTFGIVYSSGVVSPYNGDTNNNPTIYVFGGIKNVNTVTDEYYHLSADGTTSATNYIVSNPWTNDGITRMPRPRYGHRAIIINQ